jgi:uncharacterized protein with von Willebrand factor type A (vWA) domain
MSRLLDNLLIFGRVLRRAGIDVHPGRLLDVVEALEHVNLAAQDEVYHTCRALLVHRQEQIPIFDRAFAAFWRTHAAETAGHGAPPQTARDSAVRPERAPATGDGFPYVSTYGNPSPIAGASEEQADPPIAKDSLKIWSDLAGIANKDFAAFTSEELAAAGAALSRLTWNPGERRTRRWIAGRGPRLDLRRAVSESRRTGGDVVKLWRRTRRVRPRPLVLLCDVSGSMERYSRMLLLFAHAITWRHRRVEAFLFSTQLTRVTRQLRMPRPDEALRAVSRSVPDWSGGTRIGGVKAFHQCWSRRALGGGPVVLLISDGWDCGDPRELAEQIARLQRSCHRLVWLNPLIGTADYAPLTRGLQAALPFVDDFLPARTLTNLADLAVHLNRLA